MAQNNTEQENSLNIKDLVFACLRRWKWFVLSVAVCLFIAIAYIVRYQPEYSRSAEVLIKDDNQRRSLSSSIEGMTDFSLFQSKSSVYDEIKAFGARSTMQEVVRRLHLTIDYSTPKRFREQVLYANTLPVMVQLPDVTDMQSAYFEIHYKSGNNVELNNFVLNKEKLSGKVSGTLEVGDTLTLDSPIGKVVLNATKTPNPSIKQINVRKTSIYAAVSRYRGELSTAIADKQSRVITLSVKDRSIARAEDILNTLIGVYNENWVNDKNQIARSTSTFINDRLEVIEDELSNVDSDVSSYKSQQMIPDVATAGTMYMQQSNQIRNQQQELGNQLYMAKYIRNYLTNADRSNQVLPASLGGNAGGLENQIKEYNEKLLYRNNLANSTSPENPLVQEMDEQLGGMRNAIVSSVDNQITALNTQMGSLQRAGAQTAARISANPNQAKYLLSVERKQAVKQAIYLFLLQKREENELNQAFTAYNTRIIDTPSGALGPVAPKKNMIILVALMLGILIPLAIIYMIETFYNKVRGKDDLKSITAPFLGEIPFAFEQPSWGTRLWRKITRKEETVNDPIVVKPGNRNVINEAFRVLRTNLEFMTTGENKVIAVTSFNPGSGKSFTTVNLAVALAIKDKKILIVDGDLRHASMSSFFGKPHTGISNYLSKKTDDLNSLIIKSDKYKTLDYIAVGPIPPNPTELVADARFGQAIDTLKKKYDYILIDCPPVDIVADTQIIDKSADMTIFLVRAGMLDKSMLPELEDAYKSGKYRNLAVILNGTEMVSGGRYGYRYGYKYGYHYGYYGGHGGYGYYGSDKDSKDENGGGNTLI